MNNLDAGEFCRFTLMLGEFVGRQFNISLEKELRLADCRISSITVIIRRDKLNKKLNNYVHPIFRSIK